MAAGQAGRARGSLPWICAALIVLAHVALLWGLRFPAGNEPVYMASLAKSWDASFLAGDWTFGGGFHERAIFNALFGPLCAVAPIAAVTWIGRIVFWLLSVRALLRIASRLGAPPLLSAAALVAWLLYDQALVGEAWAIGTFESKCVAFWLAFEGIVAALDDRTTLAAFLAGAAFTIHPAIGLSAVAALGAGLLAQRPGARALARAAVALVVAAAPGVVQLAIAAGANGDATPRDWEFLARLRVPHHLDLAGFSRTGVFLTAALLVFNAVVSLPRARAGDRRERFLLAFQATVAAIFVGGAALRAAHRFDLLTVFPFALAPLFAPLLFFLNVARTIGAPDASAAPAVRRTLTIAALALCLGFGSLLARYRAAASAFKASWTAPADDLQHAFAWVAEHTPSDATCILPPWRSDSIFLARRPAIAWWQAARFDGVHEWRRRMEELGGDLSKLLDAGRPIDASEVVAALRAHYESLTADDCRAIARRGRAPFLVTETEYPFPSLFTHGRAHVYRVDAGE
jgi:hypothetical protein